MTIKVTDNTVALYFGSTVLVCLGTLERWVLAVSAEFLVIPSTKPNMAFPSTSIIDACIIS